MTTTTVLCLSPRCWLDEHGRARPAADGLRLCAACTRALGVDAIEAGVMHGELALRLEAPGPASHGGPTGNKPTSQEPSEQIVNARAAIRRTLSYWCRLVAYERGMNGPGDHVNAQGAYLARHAQWLAARPEAGTVADELAELARGEPRSIAYPGGGRRYQIKGPSGRGWPCPGVECTGTLWARLRRAESLVPSEIVCDGEEPHSLPATSWLAYGQKLYPQPEEQ